MGNEESDQKEFVGKKIVDTTGKIIGVCLEVVEGEDAHLIIEIETKKEGKKKSKVPMETVQGVGEMIILNVEIEGVVKGDEIVELKDESKQSNAEDSSQDDVSENDDSTEEESKSGSSKNWVLYKSIKTEEH